MGLPYVSIGARGTIMRTIHDGTIAVNGGRTQARTPSGMVQARIRAPCDTCKATYFFWRITARRKFRCPACWAEYDRTKARAVPAAVKRARSAAWRAANLERARALDRAGWHRRKSVAA